LKPVTLLARLSSTNRNFVGRIASLLAPSSDAFCDGHFLGGLVYKTIHISCVYEEVVSQIRDLISSGSLQRGDRLPSERELAEKLGVSRESIREGLKHLHSIGLVETRSHRGTFVSSGIPAKLSSFTLADLTTSTAHARSDISAAASAARDRSTIR
jgi:DNA-binding transcriptional regulator YhcF (GntR family)